MLLYTELSSPNKIKLGVIYSDVFNTLNSIVFNTAYRQEEKSSSKNKLVTQGTLTFLYSILYNTVHSKVLSTG